MDEWKDKMEDKHSIKEILNVGSPINAITQKIYIFEAKWYRAWLHKWTAPSFGINRGSLIYHLEIRRSSHRGLSYKTVYIPFYVEECTDESALEKARAIFHEKILELEEIE